MPNIQPRSVPIQNFASVNVQVSPGRIFINADVMERCELFLFPSAAHTSLAEEELIHLRSQVGKLCSRLAELEELQFQAEAQNGRKRTGSTPQDPLSPTSDAESGVPARSAVPWSGHGVVVGPGTEAPVCAQCQSRFSLVVRRTHCAICAIAFCHTCSPVRFPLRAYGVLVQFQARICEPCSQVFQQSVQHALSTLMVREQRQRRILHRRCLLGYAEMSRRREIYFSEKLTRSAILQLLVEEGTVLCIPSVLAARAATPSTPTSLEVNLYGFIGRGDCCSYPEESDEDVERLINTWKQPDPEEVIDPNVLSVILRGIPHHFRSKLWRTTLGVDQVVERHKGNYAQLQSLPCDDDTLQMIAIDVSRTFATHESYGAEDSRMRPALSRILRAMAVYRPDVGYCQGMSFLAATLLMHSGSEERGFWMLALLFERFGFDRLYDPAGLLEACETILACVATPLREHIQSLRLPLSAYIPGWVLTLLTGTFRCWAAAMTVWDVVMCAYPASRMPVRLAILMHRHYQPVLLGASDIGTLMVFLLNELPTSKFHADDVRQMLGQPSAIRDALQPPQESVAHVASSRWSQLLSHTRHISDEVRGRFA
eukprot:TRINITY_DN14754_c0_g1_i1.p1 TRINITY_DN14754_c0_g1~~TRINITY_DN14754_c0_g1_i1.p1  ORF type:complete len:598 (+),score=49.20 TRINITY_DN14754_c0_g1_i1:37-1830(+)